MTLDGKILRGLFENERLKPTNIRTSQENVCNSAKLKQIINVGLKMWLTFCSKVKSPSLFIKLLLSL